MLPDLVPVKPPSPRGIVQRDAHIVNEKPNNQHSEPRTLFDLRGSEGITESERLLATLCRKSFLRLWAQANIFTDEGFRDGKGATKELSDALVVFGKDVLILSDKHIEFQNNKPLDVAWPRWYKRAVGESARQLFGARSWLRRFPHRAFLDAACTRPLPVPIPTDIKVRFHLIAVTRGCRDAAIVASGGKGLGTLAVNTGVHGEQQLTKPFTLGQPDPLKGFVHVFDEVTVELLLDELDTAPDFIEYLKERERTLGRVGATISAAGEEDLLALYLQTMDEAGQKHRLLPVPAGEPQPDLVVVDDTLFRTLQANPAYKRKKEADRISYEWDRMVDRFVKLGDPAIHETYVAQPLKASEKGLRLLAAEGRFRRRQLADAFIGALQRVGADERLGRVVYSGVANESVFVLLSRPRVTPSRMKSTESTGSRCCTLTAGLRSFKRRWAPSSSASASTTRIRTIRVALRICSSTSKKHGRLRTLRNWNACATNFRFSGQIFNLVVTMTRSFHKPSPLPLTRCPADAGLEMKSCVSSERRKKPSRKSVRHLDDAIDD